MLAMFRDAEPLATDIARAAIPPRQFWLAASIGVHEWRVGTASSRVDGYASHAAIGFVLDMPVCICAPMAHKVQLLAGARKVWS